MKSALELVIIGEINLGEYERAAQRIIDKHGNSDRINELLEKIRSKKINKEQFKIELLRYQY